VGVATGAPFAGPLSETAGRNPTYLISTFIYLCFVLGSAKASTFGRRIACRYLVGLFSSATLATNGSSVRDQFRDVKRALVFPIIAWVNVIGALLPVMFTLENMVADLLCDPRSLLRPDSKWLDGGQLQHRLAMARLDNADHLRRGFPGGARVSTGDPSAASSGLEGKGASSCNRRLSVHVDTREERDLCQPVEAQCDTWC
jgi:hypothetical protein